MTTEEQENAPKTAVDPSPPPPPDTNRGKPNHEGRGELIKFGILVLVFVGVILVVAFSRPLIFDRVLPSIVQSAPAEAEVGTGGAAESPAEAAPTTAEQEATGGEGENTLFLPATTSEEEDAAAGEAADAESANEPAPGETAVSPTEPESAPSPIIHTVQVGDTLTNIAQRYNVPVQTLMEANNLINPNYIQVGQQLIIPPTP
jgi:LysM repeat protein